MTSSIREVLQLSEMEGPKPGTLRPASCWGHWFLLVFICFYNPFAFVLADVFGWNKRLCPEFILRWKKRNIERQVRRGTEDGWKHNMEDISFLSCFCRASWFDQWVSGTANWVGNKFMSVLRVRVLFHPSWVTDKEYSWMQMNRREATNVYAQNCSAPCPLLPRFLQTAQHLHGCHFTHCRTDLTSAQSWCLWACVIYWFYHLLHE